MFDLSFLLEPQVIASFVTLTILEIVLGIDNLILISILTDKLPKEKQALARKIGIAAAVITRLMLLSLVFFLAHLTTPLFTFQGQDYSVRDLLLLLGGLFLLAKGTLEIHHKIEGANEEEETAGSVAKRAGFWLVISQIIIMDVVFSFDSVLTAVGIAEHISVMVIAILCSVALMLFAVEAVHNFISRHPTVKVLALSYMLLIGLALIGEAFHMHIPKEYLYFAMAFSFGVELINMRLRKKKTVVPQ